MIDADASIEALLYEDEGSTLDFKQEQYRLDTDDEKGELIKDILAFTNAWRHADAYIVIGVEDNPGGRARILGVTHHLRDADLQQLVNSKTNQPITFSYRSERVDGKNIGVLHIPVQNRPRFMTRAFGRLHPDTVYLRRGSSTAKARPDEVARMGAAITPQSSPSLAVQFASVSGREPKGDFLKLEGTFINISDVDQIPDFKEEGSLTNTQYYRQIVLYEWSRLLCNRVQFAITNSALILALDIRVELTIRSQTTVVFDENTWPKEPARYISVTAKRPKSLAEDLDSSHIEVEELDSGIRIVKITISKVQPKQTVWIDSSLYLGVKSSETILLDGMIWADNISSPQSCDLSVEFATTEREMKWEEFLHERESALARERFAQMLARVQSDDGAKD